ncbi:transcriptional regulator CynR [Herbaspirillum sp. SJZ107]|uniref:transcriptional regulator CynR n=1 Tax=Herbaspirillum sp. SJZ107 TaxID=2572881 RepID=UPI00115017F4|nr:transcriptional regulator CynR [Herbaspirillum sp. SJZ107]TQK10554.1 LysR family cyn operon transcriptional activator [Herbaspirillum sp. SJZ107]
MELRALKYLIAVAEHGNFTRAAEALHVSQPALSQQILQMEDRLDAVLLDRSGRTVKVTEAGQAYIAHARRALFELESGRRAIHDVGDLSRGAVRLAMTPTFTAYLIGPLVAAFHARFPAIKVNVLEMSMDTIAAAIEADEVDLGIAFELARCADIESLPLFTESLRVVVADHHPWAGRDVLDVRSLAEGELALLSRNFVTRVHIDNYLQASQVAPKVAVEVNTISALVEIVRHSNLLTILPEAIAGQAPGLRNLSLASPPPPRTVMLLRRKSAYQSAATRALEDIVRREAVRWML